MFTREQLESEVGFNNFWVTFVEEETKDPELFQIYNEITNNASASKYPYYFMHPNSKILMFKKENAINNIFSDLIFVPKSRSSKVFTIMHLSHFGLTKIYEFLSAKYF